MLKTLLSPQRKWEKTEKIEQKIYRFCIFKYTCCGENVLEGVRSKLEDMQDAIAESGESIANNGSIYKSPDFTYILGVETRGLPERLDSEPETKRASLMTQTVKNSPAMQETRV